MLREWQAPDPPADLDRRVLAAYRAAHVPSPWRIFWTARISVPVPVLAALLLLAAALFVQYRARAPQPRPPLRMETVLMPLNGGSGCVTRLDATGFQPLPNGAARIVRSGGIRQ
jgi:hypothetical protein